MSKDKEGRDDVEVDATSRRKTSVEPVLGSSKNHGQLDDGHKSYEVNQEEKDNQSGQNRVTGNDGSTSHREDSTFQCSDSTAAPSGDGVNSVARTGKSERGAADSTDKRRSRSPEARRSTSDRDDSHRSSRSGRHDRDKRRSRSRSPNRRRDRKRSRSRSRERRSRSKSRERHRSRSKDRDRERRRGRSRSKDRRRSRSRERRYRRSRSRDRPRARSRSRTPSYCRPRSSAPAQDKTAVKADDAKTSVESTKKPVDLSHEKPSNLPLNDLSQMLKPGMMTPQMAVQQAMAAMNAKAQQLTGVTLPKYYNPAAVNPLKYAEQMQKRKLLWGSTQKKEIPAPSTNNWEQTTFAQDQDGKMAAKFKKLMGIKKEGEEKEKVPLTASEEQLRKQEELFRTLDQQYETARMSTHSFRGVGLGFTSAAAASSAALASSQIVFPK